MLNHIPPGFNTAGCIHDLVERVERTNNGVSRIVVSRDFMELMVPRLGFDFDQQQHEEEENGSFQERCSNFVMSLVR